MLKLIVKEITQNGELVMTDEEGGNLTIIPEYAAEWRYVKSPQRGLTVSLYEDKDGIYDGIYVTEYLNNIYVKYVKPVKDKRGAYIPYRFLDVVDHPTYTQVFVLSDVLRKYSHIFDEGELVSAKIITGAHHIPTVVDFTRKSEKFK